MSGAPIGVFGSAGGSHAIATVNSDQPLMNPGRIPTGSRHIPVGRQSVLRRSRPVSVIAASARVAGPCRPRVSGVRHPVRGGEAIFVSAGHADGAGRTAAAGAVAACAARGVPAGVAPYDVFPSAGHPGRGRLPAVPGGQERDRGSTGQEPIGAVRARPVLCREVDAYSLIPGYTVYHLLLTGVIGFVRGEGVTLASSAETAMNGHRRPGRCGALDDPGRPGPDLQRRAAASPRPAWVVPPPAPSVPVAPARTVSVLTALAVAR